MNVSVEPRVIYEDKNILAVSKPAGLQVHAARVARGARERPRETTLTDWLLRRYPEIRVVGDDPELRPGIVHRLDKETSGVMLLARNQHTFEYLKSLFQKGEIGKIYLALVSGIPKERAGRIDAPIGIRNGTLKRSIRSVKMAKQAVTEYKVLKTFAREGMDGKGTKFSLLEISPKTGRTHQVRVHLASIGHPVAGDRLYGPKQQPPWAGRLMLHALSLEFTDEGGKRLKFEAEPPEYFSYPHLPF